MKTTTFLLLFLVFQNTLNAQFCHFNESFENWNYDSTFQTYVPQNWFGWGIMRDSNSISGNFSVSMTGMSGCGFMAGQIMLGNDNKPGLPISFKPTILLGYYQYNEEDSATARVLLRKYNSLNNSRDTVSMGLIRLGKTLDLTPFSINILDLRPNLMPDTIEIYFSTGYPNWNDSLFIEPELKIDDIDITLPRSIIADCNLFRVEDVRLDTAKPNTLYIKIFNANCEEQITHPFIHSIKDNIGNTITNERGLDLYQHLGYTILTYPIQTSLQSMPTNFNCTVYLSYNNGWWGDNRSVCILPFQSVVTDFKIRENKKNVISVFPNPFTNKFTIQSNSLFIKNEIFKLYDLRGEQVFYKKITSREIIDIPDLKNGIYFYSIEDDKGILQRGKLIGQ